VIARTRAPRLVVLRVSAVAALVLSAEGCSGDAVTGLPDASRDRIVFSSQRDGNYELYTMNRDGSNLVRLTTTAANEAQPVPNPDGNRIAFISDATGRFQIYIMNVDGSGVTQLTGLPVGVPDEAERPTWSPAGDRILFTSYRTGSSELFVMGADGSGAMRLTDNVVEDNQSAWAPDGRHVAFVSSRGSGFVPHIYVMNANGGNVRQVTTGDSHDFSPAWSPDSRQIVFSRTSATGATRIFTMSAGGTNLRPITDDQAPAGGDGEPSWSRDGTTLLFSSARGGSFGDSDIWISQPDGSQATNLTQIPSVNDWNARWLPVP
jgi:TolB protein